MRNFIIFLFSAVTLFSINSMAGSTRYDFKEGGTGLTASGCNNIGNIFYNIEGYQVSETSPNLSRLEICVDKEYGVDTQLATAKIMADMAEQANCFETKFDETNKIINIKLLPEIKTITEHYSAKSVFTMSGFDPVIEPREKVKIKHYCVLDINSVEGDIGKFLKK